MKRFKRFSRHSLVLLLELPAWRLGKTAGVPIVKGPDDRMKADILVVVAHPDDEGGVTPYLARAIYDEHKRVAVVFATRGGSGGNDYTREHGPALADIREQEARQACAKLGDYQCVVSGREGHRFAECVEFAGELGAWREPGSAGSNCAADAAGSDHHLAAGNFYRRKSRRSSGRGGAGDGSVRSGG